MLLVKLVNEKGGLNIERFECSCDLITYLLEKVKILEWVRVRVHLIVEFLNYVEGPQLQKL